MPIPSLSMSQLLGEPLLFLDAEKREESAVCVLDASFNPPTKAHAMLAAAARDAYENATIILMLGVANADKPALSPQEVETRLAMMRLLAAEIGAPTRIALVVHSFFIDKARSLASVLPKVRRIFVMGFDTAVRFCDQKYYSEPVAAVLTQFFAVAELLVVTRQPDALSGTPDLSISEQRKLLRSKLALFGHRVRVIDRPTDGVSSSRARASTEGLWECAPPSIATYAEQHKLYQK